MPPPRLRPGLLMRLSSLLGLLTLPAVVLSVVPTIFTRHNATLLFDPNTGQVRPEIQCPVLWLPKTEPLTDPSDPSKPIPLGSFRAAFTDATDLVNFGKATHPLYHIDKNEFLMESRGFTAAKMGQRTVSFLFPGPITSMDVITYSLYEEALASHPEHTYLDLGTRESRIPAFYNYSFSLLLGQDGSDLPSPALLDCIAHGTVPGLVWMHDPTPPENGGTNQLLFNHFLGYAYYFRYLVSKFRFPHFTPQSAFHFIREAAHADAIYVMQSSLKLVQDFFYMRYAVPFEQRLWDQSQAVCTEQETNQLTPFAFCGILSGKKNFNRRQAMRSTWLRILENDIPRGFPKGIAVGGTAMRMPDPRLGVNAQDPQHLVEPTVYRSDAQQSQPGSHEDAPPLRIAYRFFVNRVGFEEDDREDPDWLLRGEMELWKDIVFVDVEPEYPIGNQGLAMMNWVANHTEATYFLKIDDDIYLRPVPFFQALAQQQRSGLYLGAFDYAGEVVRDPSSNHFMGDDHFVSDVFPPYARGAGIVFSMDLIRKIVSLDRQGKLKRLNGGKLSDKIDEATGQVTEKMSDGGTGRQIEDVSYGYWLHQVVRRKMASVTIQDLLEENFAMDPKCCSEITHPNNCWSPLKATSILVHHMSPQQLVCMFRTDVENGLYEKVRKSPESQSSLLHEVVSGPRKGRKVGEALQQGLPTKGAFEHRDLREHGRTTRDAQMDLWLQNFGGETDSDSYNHIYYLGHKFDDYMSSDLCGCVHTPAAHPDQPHEGPTNVHIGSGGTGRVSNLSHRPAFEWGKSEQEL